MKIPYNISENYGKHDTTPPIAGRGFRRWSDLHQRTLRKSSGDKPG
jgi:hypothetical protein